MAYGKIKADTLVYDNSGTDTDVTIASLGAKADLNSPTFTGTPAAPTAAANTNTTQIATTAYVQTELGDYAPLASPTFTGTINGAALTLSGNLTVNGTTTTIDSTTLTVEDKNIELGKVDTPTDTTADGGGITLKGATDKTFNWVNATDYWTSSEGIHIIEDSAANDSPDLKIESYRPSIRFKDISGSAMSGEICTDGNEIKFRVSAEVDNNTALTERATLNSSGNFAATGTVSDSKGDVRSIPQNSQGAYTLVASDAGKHILSTGTVTVPNAVFSAGDAVTIVNNTASDLTITKTINTMYNAADGTSANRTLAARGVATILFTSGTLAYISGAGLS